MATHFRCAINGVVNTQQVLNVLYAGRPEGLEVEQSVQAYMDMGLAIEAQIMPALVACLPAAYNANSITITVVNGRNEPVSTFPYEYPINFQGLSTGSPSGTSQSAILALRCDNAYGGQSTRVPKRSYLAVGPIATAFISQDGKLQSGIMPLLTALGAAIAAFNTAAGVQGDAIVSTRVGVPNQDDIGAEGKVVLAVPRPFISDRNSRRIRPTGG